MTGRARGAKRKSARALALAAALAAAGAAPLALVPAFVPAFAPAFAQDGVLGGDGGDGAIEITAEEGIDWFRDAKQYRARGDATATRGQLTVTGDELVAYYRGGEDGERQVIYRLDALGSVTVASPDGIAYGDTGVYHVEKQVAVLVGEDLRMITENATVTAEESLEYWEARSLAVARGDALVIREASRLRAAVLTAFIRQTAVGDAEGQRRGDIERIDATGGVHVSTETEIVTGREGVYDVPNERVTLCGDVKITRDENQLRGECGVVNMRTGRSRLEGRGEKVEGLILPTQ